MNGRQLTREKMLELARRLAEHELELTGECFAPGVDVIYQVDRYRSAVTVTAQGRTLVRCSRGELLNLCRFNRIALS